MPSGGATLCDAATRKLRLPCAAFALMGYGQCARVWVSSGTREHAENGPCGLSAMNGASDG